MLCDVVWCAAQLRRKKRSWPFAPVQQWFHRIYDQNLVLRGCQFSSAATIFLEMSEKNVTIYPELGNHLLNK